MSGAIDHAGLADRLAGDWTVASTSLLEDGSTRYEFSVHMKIVNRDGLPVLSMETALSRALSQVVGLSRIDEGLLLVTSFVADPDHPATAGHGFFGMVRLVFAPNLESATGTFLNYNGRYTHGTQLLTRGAPEKLDTPLGYSQLS